MAATKYTYSIQGDFPNQAVAPARLQQEIEDSAMSSALITHINTNDDDCDVWFEDPLSVGDETILDGLVAAHSGLAYRAAQSVIVDPSMEAIEPGATIVVANGRPAIEVEADDVGWGAIQARWPYPAYEAAQLLVKIKFILKATGTGTVVRLAARAKAEGVGEDSSEAWADTDYSDVTVTHTTLGEVFEGSLSLDVPNFDSDDALALQVGRDGSHANDTVDVAVQIIGLKAEAR